MFRNTSGYKGVSWSKHLKKWAAFLCVNGKQKYLGGFNTPEEASEAYNKALIKNGLEYKTSPEKLEQYRKERKKKQRMESNNKHRDKIIEKQKSPERIAYKAKYDLEHQEERSLAGKERIIKLKLAAIKAYGEICECCKEHRWELLTIDHSFNDGAKQRKETGCGKGGNFYHWLKKNNYPQNIGLRVLCWNCNSARGAYGYCPHEKEVYIMQDWE